MPQKADQMPLTIHYGCNAQHVLVSFSAPATQVHLSIEQAEAMRSSIAEAIQALKDVQSGKRLIPGTEPVGKPS